MDGAGCARKWGPPVDPDLHIAVRDMQVRECEAVSPGRTEPPAGRHQGRGTLDARDPSLSYGRATAVSRVSCMAR